MTNRELFIKEIEELIGSDNFEGFSEGAINFFEKFKKESQEEKKEKITELGQKILGFFEEKKNENEKWYSCAAIAEGLFLTSKSISGGLRGLVNKNYLIVTGDKRNKKYALNYEKEGV